ncbi:MAG: hypothetical protein AAGH87_02060 [Pseudomonadota bacterium]
MDLSDGVCESDKVVAMDQNDRDSLAWSLEYAAQRLAGALALAAPSGAFGAYVLRGTWAAACRELHYLELFVRRLLVCLAGEVRLGEAASGGCPSTAPPTAKSAEKADKTPIFPVFDAQPSLAALRRLLATTPELGRAPPAPGAPSLGALPGPAPSPVVPARRLAARFAALARVLDDPRRYARRLARWSARRRAAPALHLGAVPGLARGRGLDLARSAFLEAKRLALLTLNRGWAPPGPAPPGPSAL